VQDFRNLTVWRAARRMTKSAYELECELMIAFDFALISESTRDDTLAALI